ncbi:MAG: DNA primase [Desulfosoma sp.]
MTTSDAATRIKQAVDVLDLIGSAVPLKRVGTRYVGLCPFHREKTPSFQVDASAGLFYCFGCGAGGDVITFTMRHWNLTFPEAVKYLADRYHVPLPETLLGPSKEKPEVLTALSRTLEIACDFFASRLHHPEQGRTARDYIQKRGLPPDLVRSQRLGYAPQGWDSLLRHLKSKGIDPETAVRSGLVVRSDKGTFYDRFRHRLMFPILAPDGSLVAFGGRSLDGTEPKYLNSPETDVYHKGRTLYQYTTAREACRDARQVLLVEGYMDALAFHAQGFYRVVATLGTALTPHQVRLLQRLADEVVLVYDGDASGQKAMLRAVPLFLQQGLAASCLTLPAGMDPDDYLRTHGLQAFLECLPTRREIATFAVDAIARTWDGTVQDKVRVIKELESLVGEVREVIVRDEMIRLLAQKLSLPEAVVHSHFAGSGRRVPSARRTIRAPGALTRATAGDVPSVEETVVRLILQYPRLARDAMALGLLDLVEPSPMAALLEAMLAQAQQDPSEDFSLASVVFPDEQTQTLLARLMMEKDDNPLNEEDARLVLEERIQSLVKRRRKKRLAELRTALAHADKSGDAQARKKLLEEYQALCAAERRG